MKTTMKNTEQNAQHTPVLCAPWHVNGERGQIHDARGSLVCEMPDCFAADFNTAIYERANAIAAAPELLAALDRAVLMLEDIAAQSPENAADWVRASHRGHCPWRNHIDEARAAIAKATGKA